jgi:hypothetical protein
VERPDLPDDLSRFYAEHEGVGLESSLDRLVRLCRLDEVARIGWRDLHFFGAEECRGWEGFAALRIGMSSYLDEIVYVLDAPCCSAGAILTIGVDVAGPGGHGPATLEPSLVLATSFTEWLRHLESTGWVEYGLVPGGIAELSEHQAVRRYYHALNPGISWGGA